ncbi:MAG: phosphoribosylanthranilate isomerase [Xanthomonadales bacterium]|nr:phosphoribosylanthranilate isomerase [Xanthomonadales bacterium]
MSRVRVKICGITRAADLQAAIEAGADAVGFVFAPCSKRFLDGAAARQLAIGVPAFVSRVGLFMDAEYEQVRAVLDHVPLTLLQFHGREEAAFCRRFGLPYIKAVSMESPSSLADAEAAHPESAALLLDSHAPGGLGGTGQRFDWDLIRAASLPLILAGGLTAANVRAAVRRVRPWAVDVSSGIEDAPGIKNAEKMRTFIKEVNCEYGSNSG